ncbi:MAG: ATP-binding cassette domain-containing protein [Bdellovibrionales bacterium]
MSTVVEARNLVLEGKGRTLLSNFNLELEVGKCTVVLGPKHSGKSLLLKALASVYPISAGELFINGINVRENPHKSKESIGYIPEKNN